MSLALSFDLTSIGYVIMASIFFYFSLFLFVCLFFSRQGFSVALEPVLELPLVDQVDLELRDQLAAAHLGNGIKGVCHHCPAAK